MKKVQITKHEKQSAACGAKHESEMFVLNDELIAQVSGGFWCGYCHNSKTGVTVYGCGSGGPSC